MIERRWPRPAMSSGPWANAPRTLSGFRAAASPSRMLSGRSSIASSNCNLDRGFSEPVGSPVSCLIRADRAEPMEEWILVGGGGLGGRCAPGGCGRLGLFAPAISPVLRGVGWVRPCLRPLAGGRRGPAKDHRHLLIVILWILRRQRALPPGRALRRREIRHVVPERKHRQRQRDEKGCRARRGRGWSGRARGGAGRAGGRAGRRRGFWPLSAWSCPAGRSIS